MPKKRWKPLPAGCHVLIDGQVSGLVLEPLPERAGHTYRVRTRAFILRIHEQRLTVRPESAREMSDG